MEEFLTGKLFCICVLWQIHLRYLPDVYKRQGFQEVTAALQKDKRFLPCYRGVLINMDYISQVDSQTFRLINGEELPIALRNGKQLREAYRQYVFSGMGGIV